MVAALSVLFCGCSSRELYSNLEEKEANEIIAVLESHGIPAEKSPGEDNTFKLAVEPGKFGNAVALLSQYGLPRDKFADIGDVFKKSGLVSSPTEERIRFMDALGDSIAEALTQIDGVVTARVLIVIPNNDPFAEEKTPSSAAVFVKYRPGKDLEVLTPQIKSFITNSVEGLNYDKVSLAFFPASDETTELTKLSPKPVTQRESATIPNLPMIIIGGTLVLGALGWTAQTVIAKKKQSAEGQPDAAV
jgi:type III secretion protein J